MQGTECVFYTYTLVQGVTKKLCSAHQNESKKQAPCCSRLTKGKIGVCQFEALRTADLALYTLEEHNLKKRSKAPQIPHIYMQKQIKFWPYLYVPSLAEADPNYPITPS